MRPLISASPPLPPPVLLLVWALAACGPQAAPAVDAEATGLPACELESPRSRSLHTEGRLIVDEHGRQVILRGLNTGGRSKFPPYLPFDWDEHVAGAPPFEEALAVYLDRARLWGMTTLRVPFSWNAFEPEPGTWDEDWHARYAALLDAAAERDMWTIVDFHQDIYAESFCGDGFPEWTLEDPGEPRHDCPEWFLKYLSDDEVAAAFDAFWADEGEVQAAFATMWAELASRHADREGVVGFELVNEPGWGSADRETWAAEVLTPFYSSMVPVIQEADPDALVFFDGTGLDAIYGWSPVERPEGEDLVFAPHYYDPSMYLGGAALDEVEPGEVLELWDDEGELFEVPVLVGEFGGRVDLPHFEVYLSRHYDAFDELQLHSTQWEYSDASEAWNEEHFSVVGTDGSVHEHVVEAMVRPYPRAIAGRGARWSYDTAGEVLTLDFEAEIGGVTEVIIPEWRYGGQVALTGQGACVDARSDRLYLRSSAGGPVHLEVAPR